MAADPSLHGAGRLMIADRPGKAALENPSVFRHDDALRQRRGRGIGPDRTADNEQAGTSDG
jgi:hypothetical protein